MTEGVYTNGGAAPDPEPMRPLGVGAVLSAAATLYARNALTLWKIVGVVIIPVGIINQIVIGVSLPPGAFVAHGTLYTPSGTLNTPPAGVITEIALSVLAALVLEGAISLCLVDAYVERPQSWTHPLGEAVERLGGLLWLSILYAVIVSVGFIVVIPGIWLAVAWAVSVPALMFEHVGGFKALSRSFELSRGRWWATFAELLVAIVTLFVLLLAIDAAFRGIETGLKVSSVGLWLGLNWLGSMITDLIAFPFLAAVVAVVYIDLRVRKEGLASGGLAGAFDRSPAVVMADLVTKAGLGTAAASRPIPPFTAAHEAMRAEMRAFVETRLRPHADEWEQAQWFDDAAFGWLAEAGYLGLRFPAEYGGGDDPVAAAVWCEELARCGSGGVAAGLGAHTSIALPPIWTFGTEDQKQRYLVPGLRAEKIAALAITEPGAGSDVASLRCHAREVDGGWVVNGSKTFITGGVRADVLVTAVKTTEEGGHHGISFLIIERGPGVSSSALRKLGWHASDTAEIAFDDAFVPRENLLGAEHGGFYLIMANFQWERLVMALGAVGAMQACFEGTVRYVLGRGRRVAQSVRHQLAEIAVEVEAGRDVTYAALRRFMAGEQAVREVTIAKLQTQRSAFDVIDACVGLYGLDAPEELERALRDARLGPIGGGTDEIMKEILGRSLGL